jgi:uncharacterized protein (DUF1810 family)
MPISSLFTSCFPHLFQRRAATARVVAPGSAEGRRANFISALLNRWFRRSAAPAWQTPGARGTRPGVRRFLKAQSPRTMTQVLEQLQKGKKTSHWIWFVFPQPLGVGFSETSKHYAIRSLDDAWDFLRTPKLRDNFIRCLDALLLPSNANRSASEIFGETDARKLHACVTLFREAAKNDRELLKKLNQVQERFFNGQDHSWTQQCVEGWRLARYWPR